MSDKTTFPLSWPEGWPRTERFRIAESRFRCNRQFVSMATACEFLQGELDRLGAADAILSSNVKTRLDGSPYSQQPQPNDRGAAVYFKLKAKPTALACDKWNRVEDNVYAIAKHIEALRGQERWGVGSIDRAFTGYQALPGVGQSSGAQWWTTLGVPINANRDQVRDAYILLAKNHHPDRKGDPELFRRVQEAWDMFTRVTKEAA